MRTFALLGCSSEKTGPAHGRNTPVPIRELYSSQLFQLRLRYIEARGLSWAVLSALHGYVEADRSLHAYNFTMRNQTPFQKAMWPIGVVEDFLQANIPDHVSPRSWTIEIHAGAAYYEPLATILRAIGFTVLLPVEGRTIGIQLQWYTRQLDTLSKSSEVHAE